MQIYAIPAFQDNYIWLIETPHQRAIVVDPGDAAPVKDFLYRHQLTLSALLITHHHADHTGGIQALIADNPVPVFGPKHESIDGITHLLTTDEAKQTLPELPELEVLDTGGHTAGHISYLIAEHLFCGDTLFAGGCGRLLGGTATQLFDSLTRLKQLPDATKIYCAHEYTLANLCFALTVDPDNKALQARFENVSLLRQQGLITLPSTIATEKQTNPFLRCEHSAIRAAAETYCGHALHSALDVFVAIRRWKDQF